MNGLNTTFGEIGWAIGRLELILELVPVGRLCG